MPVEPMPDEVRNLVLTDDGYTVDLETGEVISGPETPKPEFQVADEESAEWVLRKMQACEALSLSLDMRSEVVQARAIIRRAEELQKAQAQKLAWLHARFDNELAAWAKTQMKSSQRSLKLLHGTLQFRSQNASVKVADGEAAIAWAQTHAPGALRTETRFLISEIPAEVKQQIQENLAKDPQADTKAEKQDAADLRKAFRLEPPSETFSVDSGVKGGKK